jgi:transcriptional regulator with XRE-family HTH domain
MSTRSPSLADKLNARFTPDQDILEAVQLIGASHSPCRFDSPADLRKHLIEGALLNISVIGSKALSVPCGEYLVWMTDAGHTMLVPTGNAPSREVFEHTRDQYEILTRDLMANWNKLERVLAENGPPLGGQQPQQPQQPAQNVQNLEEPQGDPQEGDPHPGKAEQFTHEIDMTTVDRPTIARTMQDRGYTVTSLATAVGVQPPAISRILRTPSDTQGDPGGRNPSMGLAAEICRVLRLDPNVAFPDIFAPQGNHKPRQQQGGQTSSQTGNSDPTNVQEGKDRAHKVVDDYHQALTESLDILEASEIFGVLAEETVPLDGFYRHVFMPSVRRIRANTSLVGICRHHAGDAC